MILIFLIIASFALFTIAFFLILKSVLNAKKEDLEANKIPRISGYSFGLGLLTLIVFIFIGILIMM